MTCQTSGNLTICSTRMKEIHREALGERWCFTHRGRADFLWIVRATVEPSYYDPEGAVACSECGAWDGDLGFGRYREGA